MKPDAAWYGQERFEKYEPLLRWDAVAPIEMAVGYSAAMSASMQTTYQDVYQHVYNTKPVDVAAVAAAVAQSRGPKTMCLCNWEETDKGIRRNTSGSCGVHGGQNVLELPAWAWDMLIYALDFEDSHDKLYERSYSLLSNEQEYSPTPCGVADMLNYLPAPVKAALEVLRDKKSFDNDEPDDEEPENDS